VVHRINLFHQRPAEFVNAVQSFLDVRQAGRVVAVCMVAVCKDRGQPPLPKSVWAGRTGKNLVFRRLKDMNILTALKLASLLISGVIGIIASVSETKDKKKRINKIGKFLLYLSICSLLLGIVCQVIESRESQISSQKSQEQLTVLADSTTKQLSYSERMIGNLDYLSITANFEFEAINGTAAEFAANAIDVGIGDVRKAIEDAQNSLNHARHHDKITGMVPVGHRGTMLLFNDGKMRVEENFDLFDNNWETDKASRDKLNRLAESVRSPVFEIRLFSKSTQQSGSSNPDLFTVTEGGKFSYFCDESNKLFMSWIFECPKTNWHQTMRMTSVADLDNATFCINFTNNPYLDGYWLRPKEMNLDFGKCNLNVNDFRFKWNNVNPTTGATNYGFESVLPPPNAALDKP
jgi:hypothetical protein